jgi:guanylate kinase
MDFSLLSPETEKLSHLTKNRATLPARKIPKRYKRKTQEISDNNKQNIKINDLEKLKIIDKTVSILRSDKTQSMDDFSKIRRTAIRKKLSK